MTRTRTATLGLLLTCSFSLVSCGTALFPRPVNLMVGSVPLPATVGAEEALTVGVRYIVGCGDFDQQVVKTSRTASTLTLRATARNRGIGLACSTGIVERTLTYTDPGTPARTGPFEVVVNGKSWGTVDVR